MKKFLKLIFSTTLVLVIAGLFIPKANADYMAEDGYGCEVGTSKLVMLKKKLKLTDDQVTQLKSVEAQAKTDLTPAVDQLKADIKSLKVKVDNNEENSALITILSKINRERRDLESSKEQYIEQVRQVLTPKQQAWLVLDIAKKMKEKMKRKNVSEEAENNSDADDQPTPTETLMTPTPDNN